MPASSAPAGTPRPPAGPSAPATPTPLPWPAARYAALLTATGPTRPWTSPFDPTLRADLPTSTRNDVEAAAARARAAQVAWAATPVVERSRVLLRLHDLLLDELDP